MSLNGKSISFSKLAVSFLIVLVIIFGSLILVSRQVNREYQSVQKNLNSFIICENSSQTIKDVSNSLTEKAQFFIMTHNPFYAQSYIQEQYYNESKQAALNAMLEVPEATDLIHNRLTIALKQTESLSSIELYAIRLAYAAMNDKYLPDEIAQIEIRPKDLGVDAAHQQKIAEEAIFGEGYLLYKERVNENCLNIISEIETLVQKNLENTAHKLKIFLAISQILQGVLVLTFISFFVLLFTYVLTPLKGYIKSIRNKESLNITGSTELRYFAETYNDVHELDPLTKILNRRAFMEICQKSEERKTPFALMLVDLDDFKNINDSYGHAQGDFVLQTVAQTLQSVFEADGDIARIGGDEFAVVFSGIKKDKATYIIEKMKSVNKTLANIPNIKGASVSGGLAFSETGYSNDLYESADKALYRVKENGKHSVAVW